MPFSEYSWDYSNANYRYSDSESGNDGDTGLEQSPKKTAYAAIILNPTKLILHGYFNEYLNNPGASIDINGDKYCVFDGSFLPDKTWYRTTWLGSSVSDITIKNYTYLHKIHQNSLSAKYINCNFLNILNLHNNSINSICINKSLFYKFNNFTLLSLSTSSKYSYGGTFIGCNNLTIYASGNGVPSANCEVEVLHEFDNAYDGTYTEIHFADTVVSGIKPDLGYSVINENCKFKISTTGIFSGAFFTLNDLRLAVDADGFPLFAASTDNLQFLRECLSWIYNGNSIAFANNYLKGCKVVSDLLFVDKANDDYRHLPTSPCIGVGYNGETTGMYGVGKALLFPDDYDTDSFVNMKVSLQTGLALGASPIQYNGVSGKIRVTCPTAHNLQTGNRIKLIRNYGGAFEVTLFDSIVVISDLIFDMPNSFFVASANNRYYYYSGEIENTTLELASIQTNVIAELVPTTIDKLYVNGIFATRNKEILDSAANYGNAISEGTGALTAYKQYIVQDLPITYDTVTYNPNIQFRTNTNIDFSGLGTVRQITELPNKQTVEIKGSHGSNPTLSGCSFITFPINVNPNTAVYDNSGNLTNNNGVDVNLLLKYWQRKDTIQLQQVI